MQEFRYLCILNSINHLIKNKRTQITSPYHLNHELNEWMNDGNELIKNEVV